MGEVCIPLMDFKPSDGYDFSFESEQPVWYKLQCGLAHNQEAALNNNDLGEVLVKIGWKHTKPIMSHPLWDRLEKKGLHPVAEEIRMADANGHSLQENDPFDRLTVDHYTTLKRGGSQASLPVGNMEFSGVHSPADQAPDSDSRRSSLEDSIPISSDVIDSKRDFDGLLKVEVVSAKDLPKQKSSIPGRFDMDPFVVVSFGKKSFKTRFKRHTLNPSWGEVLFFNVKKSQMGFALKASVYDFDSITNNDFVGSVSFVLKDEIAPFLERNLDGVLRQDMLEKEYSLNLDQRFKKYNSTLTLRYTYSSYEEMRKLMWSSIFDEYDTNKSGTLNKIEFETALESLAFKSSDEVAVSFFSKYGWSTNDEVPVADLVAAMEKELFDTAEKTVLKVQNNSCPFCSEKFFTWSIHTTARRGSREAESKTNDMAKNGIDLFDVINHMALCIYGDKTRNLRSFLLGGYLTEAYAQRRWYSRIASYVTFGSYTPEKANANILVQLRNTGEVVEEKMPTYIRLGIRIMYQGTSVIDLQRVKTLLKNMSVKQGQKFNDPNSVKEIDHFVKFHRLEMNEVYYKVPPKEFYADNAIALKAIEENDTLEWLLDQNFLSANFNNFNEFFYRKLIPGARVIDTDPDSIVSPADCRLGVFESIDAAKRLWIKGESFNLEALFKNKDLADYFDGGSMCICRLAPQDYHRFHHPVDGTVSADPVFIEGEYYTVNPMAIRIPFISVYSENTRAYSIIESPTYGKVAYVMIGAMMVGSIKVTSRTGESAKKGDEHGYFAFGGSTILLFFKKDAIVWDEDLKNNSEQNMETLVRMGMSIGKKK